MHAGGFRATDVLEPLDAGFDHFQTGGRHLFEEGQGLVHGGVPGVEIPPDHADHIGAGFHGALELGLIGDFHDGIQALGLGELQQGEQPVLGEQGGHEEDGIRAEDLALLDLVLLEDELAAEEGHLHRGAGFAQALVLAVVEELVGGHGEGLGAVLHQALGMRGRLVVLADLAAARIATGDLGDDRNSRLAELLAQGVMTPVGLLDRHGAPLLLDLHIQGLEDGDLF